MQYSKGEPRTFLLQHTSYSVNEYMSLLISRILMYNLFVLWKDDLSSC